MKILYAVLLAEVSAGFLDNFALFTLVERSVFSEGWDESLFKFEMISTITHSAVCDWTADGPMMTYDTHDQGCGAQCKLLSSHFNGIPAAVVSYSPSDHVQVIVLRTPCPSWQYIDNLPACEGTEIALDTNGDKMGNLFMAFRGTYMWDVINNRRNMQSALSPVALCTDCLAHTGFWSNFKALRFGIHSMVSILGASLAGSSNANVGVKLVITGHSMGGSLATFASIFLTERVLAMYAGSDLVAGLYTFGTPRVGNSILLHNIRRSALVHYQVALSRDPIPHFPPRFFGYRAGDTILEVWVDPMYYVGFQTGEIDSNYAKYFLFRTYMGPNADSSFASSRTFFAMGDHMNYFIGLDDADFGACGGTADYYVKVTGASYLFGA
jgi:hypothetical protein